MDQNQQKCQLHVRSDSKDSLDALFQHVRVSSQSGPKSSKLFRERDLPPSFFVPPKNPPNWNNNHHRSKSLPSLPQQTINPAAEGSMGGQQNQTQGNDFSRNHQRMPSTGNILEGPLPHGWESRETTSGQRYFIK